jgi:predicted small metal-binding protein
MAYQVDCSQGDGFTIKSEDEQEVVEHVKEHAKEKHEMDLSDDEARDMIQ